MRSILIVDDDAELREQLARAFRRRQFEVRTAGSCAEALTRIAEGPSELAVVDLRMPDDSGMKVLSELRRLAPETRVVMLTGFGSIANAVAAMRLGATNYVPKPAHADEILAAFDQAAAAPVAADSAPGDDDAPSLAQAEWEHIQRVLGDCGGNISKASRRLDISRRSLQRKLRRQAPD